MTQTINYLEIVKQKLEEAAEAYSMIPFDDGVADMPLISAIARASLEARRLDMAPQNGTSLKDYVDASNTS